MAENSKIEWCHHTFNPWRGCRALSDACANCYAKVLVEGRLQQDFGIRTRAAESTWKQPLSWNRKAAKEGVRYRVFCASLADVFDAEVPDSWRDELFALIAQTPHLDWLLLTKRPKVARTYISALPERRKEMDCDAGLDWCEWPLPNVWLGTTVENQAMAEARIPHLLATPAAVRFLSMEPLLGSVDLTRAVISEGPANFYDHPNITRARFTINALAGVQNFGWRGLDWVITGGESGPGARPSHPDWFRSIRDQCAAAGVPFLFKQHGDWLHTADDNGSISYGRHEAHVWKAGHEGASFRVGKARAGRHLDGVLHDGYPVVG